MPSAKGAKNQCQANLKSCAPWRGGCGYRYKETDLKWQEGGVCPRCGMSRRCQKHATDGYKVCKVHGSGSPHKGRPGGRPPVTTDIFQPNLPLRLLETYRSAIEDDRLYQLRSDIAILEARKHDIIDRIRQGDTPETWEKLKDAWDAYLKAQALAQIPEMKAALYDLGQLIESGYASARNWKEFDKVVDRKSRLATSEIRHMEIAQRMISIEKLMLLADKLADIIDDRVHDEHERKMIFGDIYEVFNLGNYGNDVKTLPFVIREQEPNGS